MTNGKKQPSSFPSLVEASNRINAESDKLLALINDIELVLAKFNLGVSAWVMMESWPGEHGDDQSFELGYDKFDKKWALCTRFRVDSPGFEEIKKLRDSSREDKIQAGEHLSDLLTVLVKEANQKADQIVAATNSAKDILGTLTNQLAPERTTGKDGRSRNEVQI